MTIDSIIYIATLLVAIFAILPSSSQKTFLFRFSTFNKIISILLFIFINILIFYNSMEEFGWFVKWPFIIGPNEMAYLVVLTYFVIEIIVINTDRLTVTNIHAFSELIDAHFRGEQYSEVTSLLEQEYFRLVDIYQMNDLISKTRSKFFQWGKISEINSKILSDDSLRLIIEKSNKKRNTIKIFAKESLIKISSRVYYFLPNYENQSEIAGNILRKILSAEEYVKFLVKTKPYLGLSILQEETSSREEFLDLYISSMVANPRSVLYEEVSNYLLHGGDNFESKRITNTIFYYFLHNVETAFDLGFSYQISEKIINILRSHRLGQNIDIYNQEVGNYDSKSKFKCPIYIGIHSIDIIVKASLIQDYHWHMELYSFCQITDEIILNYRPNPIKSVLSEWNNKYSFLLCEMFQIMGDWVRKVKELPPEQKNLLIKRGDASHENENIPKSSLICLALCLNTIILSDKVDQETKQKITGMVIGLIFDLSKGFHTVIYKEILINCLIAYCNLVTIKLIYSCLHGSSTWISNDINEYETLKMALEGVIGRKEHGL
jgi:hypothetical protein